MTGVISGAWNVVAFENVTAAAHNQLEVRIGGEASEWHDKPIRRPHEGGNLDFDHTLGVGDLDEERLAGIMELDHGRDLLGQRQVDLGMGVVLDVPRLGMWALVAERP